MHVVHLRNGKDNPVRADSVEQIAREEILNVLRSKNQGSVLRAEEITGGTMLVNGPIPLDSLDLVEILVALQQRTGKDPFSKQFTQFRTVDDLIALFS